MIKNRFLYKDIAILYKKLCAFFVVFVWGSLKRNAVDGPPRFYKQTTYSKTFTDDWIEKSPKTTLLNIQTWPYHTAQSNMNKKEDK